MTVKLSEYEEKRNFDKTPEPKGDKTESDVLLRFVVQHHLARRDHYDFRLEWGGALMSFALPKGPSYDIKDKRLAVKVEDHPLEYRNFEGIIPKGEYGGGTVMLWDEGAWEPLGDVNGGLNSGALKFVLNGRRLKGKWALIRMKTDENWLLLKEKDEYVKDNSGITAFNTSIRTGRTMEEIENGADEKTVKNPFDKMDVQLAKFTNTVPEGNGWVYELKFDGYRVIAFIEGGRVRLMTRNNNDCTARFSVVAEALLDWAGSRAMVLDGEMAVTDASGKTDFQALQSYLKHPKAHTLTYILFDLLALNGADLRKHPLMQRKETLEALMTDAPESLRFSRHVYEKGMESFNAACQLEMEGIIGKKADSVYSGTRNGDWIKLKCPQRQAFVIGGFTLTEKNTSGLSSLLLGNYDGDELLYVGRAGTGFNRFNVKELQTKFNRLKRAKPPFKNTPVPKPGETITWLEPRLFAQIQFTEMTNDNLLRQASYKGLVTDENPLKSKILKMNEGFEKTMETNSDGTVDKKITITSPDKVVYDDPVITKADVVRYYEAVSKRMFPYVSHRVLSVLRCPDGIAGSCFFKKHPSTKGKGVATLTIPNSDGEPEEYIYIENESGILFEVQMNTLEFHIWGSDADEPEKPDMMVFDLDPDEGMELSSVRQGVRDMRATLSELSLISYLKTSGGKGYHVVVPLKPSVTWHTVHDFAKQVAEVMQMKWPDRYTSNIKKAKRTDKIFIDWMRNTRGATSIAPYSVRARKGAKVSLPIFWEELDNIAPDGITMKEALLRIGGDDPWKDFFENNQLLKG